MGLFGGKSGAVQQAADAKALRHSSGWAKLSSYLKTQEGLRILDIGPTSAGNINYLTDLGHSVYMANLVEDASRPEFVLDEGYNVDKFVESCLDFQGRTFDVVALWDTADYLPEALLQPTIDRLYGVMPPNGQLLAFFHSKREGDDTVFCRYHLAENDQVRIQRVAGHPMKATYTNRQVEGLFRAFGAYKFFLAKDSLREVLVTR